LPQLTGKLVCRDLRVLQDQRAQIRDQLVLQVRQAQPGPQGVQQVLQDQPELQVRLVLQVQLVPQGQPEERVARVRSEIRGLRVRMARQGLMGQLALLDLQD
jgi:hypothetical protein